MKKLIPNSKCLFLNYEIDIKYGPQNCVEQKLEVQLVFGTGKDDEWSVDIEVVDVLETKIFGNIKSFPSWKERKDFMNNFDLMFNIDSNKEEDKAVDSIFTEKVKKELIKKYSKLLK